MKFLSLALVGLLAAVDATSVNNKEASPYVRKLGDGQYDDENADGDNYDGAEDYVEAAQDVDPFAATSNNKIQFNQCITVTIQSGNLMMDNLVDYTKAGTLTAVRNYAIFDVCDKSEGCQRNHKAPFDSTFMVDLPTFMFAAIEEGFNDSAEYCEACVTFGQDCGYSGAANRRDLGTYATIDCSKCKALGCYDVEEDNAEGQNNNNNNANAENALAWAEAISSCYSTGTYWNGILLYAGWMCTADGTGVQIGMFLDKTCRMYHSGLSYANVMTEQDYWTMVSTKNTLPAMFVSSMDCADGDDQQKTYVSKATYSQYAVETYEAAEASATCQAIFGGYYFTARSLSNCGDIVDYSYKTQGATNYDQDWYTYELSRTDLFDQATICEHVKSKYQSNNPLKYNIFSAKGSGSYYNYTATTGLFGDLGSGSMWWKSGKNNRGGSTNNWWGNNQKADGSSSKMSPAGIFFLVLFAVAVTAAAMHYTTKKVIKKVKKRKEDKEAATKLGTDSKKAPLIIT